MRASVGGAQQPPASAEPKPKLHSPPVELPSSNAQNFFEEAKITHVEEAELKRRFVKFCTREQHDEEEEQYLTLDDFCRMLQHYECSSALLYEPYFHAIDRNNDEKLDFDEFFLGSCAADPSTVHILNSFTGLERARYIFDFYDVNRQGELKFEEFAKLMADCLSVPSGSFSEDGAMRQQAVSKAVDLHLLEEGVTDPKDFVPIVFEKFHEFIRNELLRGTSRLFRYHKSILRARSSRAGRRPVLLSGSNVGVSGRGPSLGASSLGKTASSVLTEHMPRDDQPSDQEDFVWHAHLLELDEFFDPEGDEPLPTERERHPNPPAYSALPLASPPPPLLPELDPADGPSEVRSLAQKVLRCLSAPCFEGLLPPQGGTGDAGSPFIAATPAQLHRLCSAAIRLLELEDMVITGLQPPVKIFGSIHGQVLDLLSHLQWHLAPMEDGDILYNTYLFLGDYADRGSFGLEALTLVLSMKVAYPHRVVLLRGHHENRSVNFFLGLRQECERRLGAREGNGVYEQINRVFEHLSLAAVIGGQLVALGPGVLPPALVRLEQLRRYKKPLALPHPVQARATQPADQLAEQLLLELFVPPLACFQDNNITGVTLPESVNVFCSQNRVSAIVRSRVVPPNGFSFEASGRIITVTSCVNYCDLPGGNDAAILHVTKEEGCPNLSVRPTTITSRVAKIHSLLGAAVGGELTRPPPVSRWPAQYRAATPGRSSATSGSHARPASVRAATMTASAVVVKPDHSVVVDSSTPVKAFPAYGPGRMPTHCLGGVWSHTRGQAAAAEAQKSAQTSGGQAAQSGPVCPSARAGQPKAGRAAVRVPGPPAGPSVARVGAAPVRPRGGEAVTPSLRTPLAQAAKAPKSVPLPPAPGPYLQQGGDDQEVTQICRLWLESGLTEREWTQGLQMFEAEMANQPRQLAMGGTLEGGGVLENRWTLETFSVWLLKRGRRLRECTQWFRAFDFDQDDMISSADFMQGLVASAAPVPVDPASSCGLCAASAAYRLLDVERQDGIDAQSLESLLQDAQYPANLPELSIPLAQAAEKAIDFDFFRSTLIPRLQNATAFRLRVFGTG